MTDIEHANKLVIRDEDPFKQLVDKYQKIIITACYRFVHAKETAEDISQEVFIEVIR